MEDFYDLFNQYAFNDENYKVWRQVHTKAFGDIFSSAFLENVEGQIHLTAALINISQSHFIPALTKLNGLLNLCRCDYDRAVVHYFTGLTYEMLENKATMTEHYDCLQDLNVSFIFPLAFHPYYRTAKFYQRDSECSKSIEYYQKALSFYDNAILDPSIKASIAHIIYDIATVCLYMHEYNECERFLTLSETYDNGENQNRKYVRAILRAVQGRENDARFLLEQMNPFFRMNCEPMLESIMKGSDLHYCVIPQNQSAYASFWNELILQKEKLQALCNENRMYDFERMISDKLSTVFSFMKRQLSCRIQLSDGNVAVLCKTYYVKTLVEEYKSLFSIKPQEFDHLNFVWVNEFGNE